MKHLNDFVRNHDGEIIQKKVKTNDDSQCQTIINENSNSMDSLTTLSKSISKVINKPSLRERFEHITSPQSVKESKYFSLVEILNLIDSQLLFLKQRRESLFWPNIQKGIFDSSQKNLSIRQIQEIKQVWTESYVIYWEKFEKFQGKYELLVKFTDKQLPNSMELNKRKEFFTEKLTNYLLTNGDYIEPINLPQKPEQVNLFMSKEAVLLNKLDSIKPSLSVSINVSKIFSDKKDSSQPLSNVSMKLIEKIRERKLQEKQQKEECGTKQQSSKKQQIFIATMLHQYYFQRDVSNMFFANVVKYIFEHNKSMLMSIQQIEQTLNDIIATVNSWLTIVENPNGKLLRMNKEQELPSIINQLT